MYSGGPREFPPTEDNPEEEDNTELPAAGLEEPLEAIRKLGAQQPDVSSVIETYEMSQGLMCHC